MSRSLRQLLLLAAGAVLLGVLTTPARADRRAVANTYEYQTMPQGETELELYSTQSRAELNGASGKDFDLQLAIEHGITERWDVSFFHRFAQRDGVDAADSEAFHFEELRLRTRYRFAERGELPVDLQLVAEGARSFADAIYEGDLRAVLARDFDRLTVALNLVGTIGFGPALDEPAIELGYAAGLTYEVVPEWTLGVESWGAQPVDSEDGDLAAWAGPVLSWAPAHSFWITATAGFGVTDAADELAVRVLMGVHL
jgi:hypothetical protein